MGRTAALGVTTALATTLLSQAGVAAEPKKGGSFKGGLAHGATTDTGDPAAYRLCLGYAGWGPGQLEREVIVGGWLTAKASTERIFDTPIDKVWDAVIRDLGFDPAFLMPAGGPQ